MSDRPCTCHPDDNPPVPCPQKYALSECKAAPAPRQVVMFNPFTGQPRDPRDIQSDPYGQLIWDGETPLAPAHDVLACASTPQEVTP